MNKLRKFLFLLIAVGAVASMRAADWKIYPPFAGVEKMAETKGRVYFISNGALFAYDKDNNETLTFSHLNDLNDTDVTGVYAPFQGSRAVVSYVNGNMDLLLDDGRVINLPDIKDARVNSKTINHIAFSPDGTTMIVATSFGIVRYNLVKMEVVDSGIFNLNAQYAGFINGNPALIIDNHLYMLGSDGSIRTFSTWKDLGQLPFVTSVTTVNEEMIATMDHPSGSRMVKFFYDEGVTVPSYRVLTEDYANQMGTGTTTEPLLLRTDNVIRSFNLDGQQVGLYPITGDIAGFPFTAAEGMADMWFGTEKGLVNADISSNPIYVSEAINPGSQSVKNIHILNFGPSGNLYMGNRGNSVVFNITTSRIRGYQAVITADGVAHNTTAKGLSEPWYSGTNPEGYLLDPFFMTEDPTDSTSYFTGNLYHGIFKLSVEDGSEKLHYHDGNLGVPTDAGMRVLDAKFDSYGNLWVIRERINEGPTVFVITADGLAKGDKIEVGDVRELKSSTEFNSGRDAKLRVSKNGRFIYAKGNLDIMVIDTKGTPDLNDDVAHIVTTFRLSDGTGYISVERFNDILEDPNDGSLWVATSDGIFVIPKPWDIDNGILEVMKPKVPRNDGTGLADYLLSSLRVYSMAIDGAGHKWFTTDDSGVYLTNSKGTEIMANYNTSNSPLPSNRVFSVATPPSGDERVFFGTEDGLMEYRSGYSAGSDDFNNVKIYPNPVRPEYRGEVIIEGLVDGALVKIVSASGALVAQMQSEGGMLHWNPNGANGKRLPAGVYHVLASSDKASGKPVGKIMIIR